MTVLELIGKDLVLLLSERVWNSSMELVPVTKYSYLIIYKVLYPHQLSSCHFFFGCSIFHQILNNSIFHLWALSNLTNFCLIIVFFFQYMCITFFFQFFNFGVKGKREVNVFSNLLKHNWHVTLCKLKYTVKLFDISIYCKMITTVKLANTSITSYRICVCMCGVNFENLFLW